MDKIRRRRILIDFIIIALSIFIAGLFAQSELLNHLVAGYPKLYPLSSLIAGLFFTSVFTTAPAMVALGKLTLMFSPLVVALIGALGALIGDLVIFTFIKGHIAEDISYLLSKTKTRRLKHIFHYRFIRWSLAFLGAIIIASPLPDELGLTLMGLSRMSTTRFVLISYLFNFIGILAIGFVARSF